MAIPYALLAVLAFTTPDLNESGKLVYAYITYGLLMLFYTATNIPYYALGGVMTGSTEERASIQPYRFAMAMVGGAIVAASVMPLVNLLGKGDQQKGFQLTMMVLSLFAIACFVICFASTRERISPDRSKNSSSIWEDVKATLSNEQWRIIALVTLILHITVAMRGAITPFYVNHYLKQPDLISIFLTSSMIAGVFGALFSNWMIKYMCKIKLLKMATFSMVVINSVLFFVPNEWAYVALFITALASFAHMIFIPIVFSTIPDTVDYGSKKYANKAMAMSFSGHLLALKFGLALGGAFAGWILAYSGYKANAQQTEQALLSIVLIFAVAPAIASTLNLFFLKDYKLTKGFENNL